MVDKVERVARAIWTMYGDSFPHDTFDNLPESKKKIIMIYARHAIDAMKDDSEVSVKP